MNDKNTLLNMPSEEGGAPNLISSSGILTFKPLSEFSHIESLLPCILSNYEKIKKILSIDDFNAGLDPLEPRLMYYIQKFAPNDKSEGFSVLSFYKQEIMNYDFISKRSAKEIKAIDSDIIEKIGEYLDSGVFRKAHLRRFMKDFNSNFTADLIHRMIEKNHLTFADTVEIDTGLSVSRKIPIPLMFALNSRHHERFFETHGAEAVRALGFEVKRGDKNCYLTPAQAAVRERVFDYLSYAEFKKDKKALLLCAQYLGDDKSEKEKIAVDAILSNQYGIRGKLEQLELEIKKQNQVLVNHIDDPRLQASLNLAVKKDLMEHAIEAKHTELTKKRMTMEVFQKRKNKVNQNDQCYVGFAAMKGQVSIERLLVENDFYDLTNFGSPHSGKTRYQLSRAHSTEKVRYEANVPQLSDSTLVKLMGLGLEVDVKDLIIHKNTEAYTLYTQRHPANVCEDHALLRSVTWLASLWMDKGGFVFQYKHGEARYTASQSHIPIVLQTIHMIEKQLDGLEDDKKKILSQMSTWDQIEDKKNVLSQTSAWDQIEDKKDVLSIMGELIRHKFLKSLGAVEHAQTAGFAMNQYLKYFPHDKPRLLNQVSTLNNAWALKLDKKNLDSELSAFLNAMDLKPTQNAATTKKNKI